MTLHPPVTGTPGHPGPDLPANSRPATNPAGTKTAEEAKLLLERTEQQITDLHAEHQQVMAQIHRTYLEAAQGLLSELSRFITHTLAAPHRAAPAAQGRNPLGDGAPATVRPDQPPTHRSPDPADAAFLTGGDPATRATAPAVEPAPPHSPEPPDSTASPAAEPAEPVAGGPLSAERLSRVLRGVVADLTGYPDDILTDDMALETDLGIDSIKRVQILAALRQEVPELAQVEVSDVAALRTMGDILERLAQAQGEIGREISLQGQAGGPAPPRLTRLVPGARRQRPPGLALSRLDAGVLITDEGRGIAPALAAELTAHGVRARVVAGPLADGRAGDDEGCVVLLDALRDHPTPADVSTALHRDLLGSLRAVAPASAARPTGREVSVVLVQDGGGDFGLGGRQGEDAWLNGATALARTAAREWPYSVVKAIDCASTGRTAVETGQALARELLTGGDDPEVALAANGERRILLHEDAAPLPAGGTGRVGSGSFLVVTGGGRGITAHCLAELAARAPGIRLLLLGRTPLTDPADEEPAVAGTGDLPSLIRLLSERDRATGANRTPAEITAEARRRLAGREVRATVRRLEEAGATVRYAAVDVRDPGALQECLSDAREHWGPVTGLVHAAGVIADKPLANKTDEQFDAVFSTKVDSLRHLLAATAGDPLDTICLFSSISAAVGNPGQADYAAANAVLDHVAASLAHRRPGTRVVSMAWGPWRGGMVTPGLQEHFSREGAALIEPEDGAAAFADEITAAHGPVHVLLVPDASQLARWGAAASGAPAALVPKGMVRVGGEHHPELADHAIAGRVVLPVATAVEWLARAVPGERAEGEPFALHDVRVRSTVTLHRYPQAQWLSLHSTRAPAADGWPLELRAGGRCPRFTAVAPLVPPAAPDTAARPPCPPPAPCAPMGYGGKAHFHGPLFQVVRKLEGCDEHGAVATLHGRTAMGWPEDPHARTDAALVDGAMQLAVLWAEGVLGRPSLPMAVSQCLVHRPGPARSGPVTCRVTARSANDLEALCDAFLTDEDGAPQVTLLGIRLIVRPD
ncbi:SDR family NAD(P)-dependent oxidoreductase [Streptomyces rubradiris]|uniref:SDR family NAD(P)-dependent oxidoreductase n=1 Tax=Streptomyces rubradiris TaxID=285531 RepID=UPI0033E65AE0